MKNFKTIHDFVVTSGKNDYLKGAYCSVEHAETRGERLRVGTEYTIWRRINKRWHAYRTRESS